MPLIAVGTGPDGKPIMQDDGYGFMSSGPAPAGGDFPTPPAPAAPPVTIVAPSRVAPLFITPPAPAKQWDGSGAPPTDGYAGVGQGREAISAYDGFLKRKELAAEAKRGQGAGRYAAKPEYEQRLSVGRQQSEGPDPAVEAERRFLTQGAVPIERVAPAQRQLSGRELLAIMDPPANVKPKERQAWADSYAADLSSKGISLATAAAEGILGKRAVPGANKMNGEQLTAAEDTEEAGRQQLITAIDARYTTREGNVSQANLAAQQQADKWQADFGGEGIEGNAAAAAKVDQRLIDQRTGFSSVEKAEEGAGQMVKQPDGSWEFEQAQDRTVWTPGANEAKGIAEEKFQSERARLLKEQDDKVSSVMADIDKQVADIGSGKIDPNGFYADKSTGERIGIAIAQAMGTFASAYGVKNTANDIIQSAIDRDVQAQIENMKEKRGKLNDSQALYKRILDSTGSKVAAEEALKLASFAKVDKDLGAAEAQAHTEKAKIAIQDIRARVRLQNLDRQAEITERTRGTKSTQSRVVPAVAGGYSAGYNPDKDIEAILQKRVGLGTEAAKLDLAVGGAAADEAKARAAAKGKDMPTVTWQGRDILVRPGVPESTVAKAYDAASSGQTLLGSLAELDEQQKKLGANTMSRKEAEIMVRSLVGAQINQLVGGGAMNNDEAASMINTLTDSMTGGDAAGARGRVKSFVTRRVQDQLRTIEDKRAR